MTLCSMGLGASWTISYLLVSCVSKLDKSKDMAVTGQYVKHVVPIGGFAAFSLALGNYTYLYLSVSFIQMLKAAVPCVTMLVLVAQCRRTASVLAYSPSSPSAPRCALRRDRVPVDRHRAGVLLQILRACRMAVLQCLLGNLRFELVEGLYVMAPASFGFLVLGIAAFEWDSLVAEDGFGKIARAPHKYMCAAVLGFFVNLLTLAVIKSTSSLTFKVIGQVKNTVVILVSVALFGSAITGTQVVRYSISMVGFAVYQRGKQLQTKDEADALSDVRAREKGKGVMMDG